ncbi:hypothetical protein DFH07DRAFT_946993 [Mycena maculata]|uniref:Uncharacterized protein n=1 Tax=Mycena maculata TaxID=230809 RepID=A0AAD7HHG8_9AGAR|nr:hypothetical protein DFH07DRAFT_946993 [Mycena maculata]
MSGPARNKVGGWDKVDARTISRAAYSDSIDAYLHPGLFALSAFAISRRLPTIPSSVTHSTRRDPPCFKKNWLENELEKHKFSKAEKFSLTESNNLGAAEAVVERSGLGNTFSHAERMQEPKVQLKVTLSGQLKISGRWRQLAAANCGSAAAAEQQFGSNATY